MIPELRIVVTPELRIAQCQTCLELQAVQHLVSEKLNHHPEWRNVYGTVELAITDHDAGGLSDNDRRWVAMVDALG